MLKSGICDRKKSQSPDRREEDRREPIYLDSRMPYPFDFETMLVPSQLEEENHSLDQIGPPTSMAERVSILRPVISEFAQQAKT